jgi:hypothetical protein
MWAECFSLELYFPTINMALFVASSGSEPTAVGNALLWNRFSPLFCQVR